MSSTSTTQYYGLTQYVGTDKPDFADNNVAFRDVDAALHGVVQDAEGFATDITNLQTDVAAAQSAITTLQSDLDTAEAAIVTINNKDLAQDAEIARVDTNSKDMITAYNEASATSTHAYAIGDYFIYNNVLYRAIAAIAIGDTIVPDTNCTTTNVTSELIQLNSDLSDLHKNTLGNAVNLSDKTSSSNIYQFPSDGYLDVRCNQIGYVIAHLCSPSTTSNSFDYVVRCTSDAGASSGAIFVKKNMRFYMTVSTSEAVVKYRPLQ